MAGDHPSLIREGQQPVVDGSQDLPGVAPGQIGSSNRTGKESVTGNQQILLGKVQTDAPLRVAWSMKNVSEVVGDAYHHAFFGARVGWSDVGRDHSQPARLHVHHLQQRQIVFIQQNGGSGRLLKLDRSTYMIDMRMGDDDLPESEAVLCQAQQDIGYIVAWVDHHGFAHRLVAHNGAVALQRADGEGFENHELIVGEAASGVQMASQEMLAGLPGRTKRWPHEKNGRNGT